MSKSRNSPLWMFAIGWVLSGLVILLFAIPAMMFFNRPMVVESMKPYGYPQSFATYALIMEITCGLLYAFPRTAVLGAILLTGYLGGAVATHIRAGQPPYLPIIVGIVVWLGLFLRDARIRALIPWRA